MSIWDSAIWLPSGSGCIECICFLYCSSFVMLCNGRSIAKNGTQWATSLSACNIIDYCRARSDTKLLVMHTWCHSVFKVDSVIIMLFKK